MKTKKKVRMKIRKKTKYRAHGGSKYSDKQAQEIGDNLEVIRQFHGGEVTPRQILDFAQKKSSRLYKYFEWNDAKAAEKYRLSQASYMLRVVYIEVETSSGPSETRAFVSIKSHSNKTRKYTSVSDAMDDQDYYQVVLEDIVKQLVTIRNKHRNIKELKSIFGAIDRLKL